MKLHEAIKLTLLQKNRQLAILAGAYEELKTGISFEHSPDYVLDLNAICCVAQRLTPEQHKEYTDALCKQNNCAWYQSGKIVDATAEQRAAALIYALSEFPLVRVGKRGKV